MSPSNPSPSPTIWKWLVSGSFICASIIYALWPHKEPLTPLDTPVQGTTQSSPTVEAGPAVRYTDGIYTGDAVNAYYGIVQVKVTVEEGALTNITLLKKPDDRPETIQVSNRSFPLLIQEALEIQNADVHGVSGATQTSDGFRTSLTSALIQAAA